MNTYLYRPAIGIAGPAGSFKSSLAERISFEYGFDRKSIGDWWKFTYKEVKREGVIPKEMSFEEFWSLTNVEQNKSANDMIIESIKGGNVVIDFRYPFMYRDLDSHIFNIYMQTDIEKRVEGSRGRDRYKKLGKKAIRQILERREEDEVTMGKLLSKTYLGEELDFRDPRHYNLVVPADVLSPDERLEFVTPYLTKYFEEHSHDYLMFSDNRNDQKSSEKEIELQPNPVIQLFKDAMNLFSWRGRDNRDTEEAA